MYQHAQYIHYCHSNTMIQQLYSFVIIENPYSQLRGSIFVMSELMWRMMKTILNNTVKTWWSWGTISYQKETTTSRKHKTHQKRDYDKKHHHKKVWIILTYHYSVHARCVWNMHGIVYILMLQTIQHLFIIAGTSTRSFDTTAQQCQRWAERAQAGQVMAWVLPDHRTHREGSVSTV